MSRFGFFFYTGDWIKNTRTISMQARGAWIDLLCYMDEKQPRGKMRLNIQQYAVLLGCSAEIAGGILVELEVEGVADVSPSLVGVTFPSRVTASDFFVTVKCRRMLREESDRELHRLRQQRYRERRSSDGPVTPVNPSPSPSPSIKEEKKRESLTLPIWLPESSWQAFKEHRRKLRKPLTPRAEELAIRELDKLRLQGYDPSAVIDSSILNGWQGLFPPRETSSNQTDDRIQKARLRGL